MARPEKITDQQILRFVPKEKPIAHMELCAKILPKVSDGLYSEVSLRYRMNRLVMKGKVEKVKFHQAVGWKRKTNQ